MIKKLAKNKGISNDLDIRNHRFGNFLTDRCTESLMADCCACTQEMEMGLKNRELDLKSGHYHLLRYGLAPEVDIERAEYI